MLFDPDVDVWQTSTQEYRLVFYTYVKHATLLRLIKTLTQL